MLRQMAIYYTRTNASLIARTLFDYDDPADLNEAYYHLFPDDNFEARLVLAKSILPDGKAVLSYVVHESVFRANARTTEPLNDETFVEVIQL